MKAFVAFSIAAALSNSVVWEQTAKQLPAAFVAERANSVTWNSDGSFLGYSFGDSKKQITEAGVYDLRPGRGKTLLRATAEQTIDDLQWLAGDPLELAIVSEQVASDSKSIRKTIYALDGRDLSIRKIWSESFAKDQTPQLFVEASPSLTHAIVTIHLKSEKDYLVITTGANETVISTDISQAIKQGDGFAGWTVDGTAFFGGGSKDDLAPQMITAVVGSPVLSSADGSVVQDTPLAVTGEAVIATGFQVQLLANEFSQSFRFSRAAPTIPAGTVGFELIPNVGSLRQVRYSGPWVQPAQAEPATMLGRSDNTLTLEDSTGKTKSLWLSPMSPAVGPSYLVSPQAESAWLHPNGRTVAFTFNGVLFVRTITGS